MILSINLAILTFLSFLSNFLKHFRVGGYENLFIFFWKAIKIAWSAQKNRSGRVSGYMGTFFRPNYFSYQSKNFNNSFIYTNLTSQ